MITWRRVAVCVFAAGAISWFSYSPNAQSGPCGLANANPVACENLKTGNPESEWDGISGAGDPTIQGYATDISVNKGGTIAFKVDTNATAYTLNIFRLGYYGGMGARKVATVTPSVPLPQSQPACLSDPTTGLVDCGNWRQSASWTVPADAVSGIYLVKLVRTDTGGASHMVFVVRDDNGNSTMLFQTSDTTWQAYNEYGGNSLYVGSPAGRAYKVSYNRPFTTRTTSNGHGQLTWLFGSEYPMLRWMESNGYDVSYFTGMDVERRPAELLKHRVFLSVGHDEYWSAGQRTAVENARAAGVNLGFFSGNEIFWKTRWEPSIDGTNTPNRTLVSYKETHANAKIDPQPNVWTGTWRDPRFSPPADGGRPENALSGTIFMVNCCRDDAMTVSAAAGKLRFWRNTSIASLAPNTSVSIPGILGHEVDAELDNGFRPANLIRLATTTLNVDSLLLDYGSTYGSGSATHALTLYRHSSGALVFSAGTIQWPWSLDINHEGETTAREDDRIKQATVNLFADMGAQPATLQQGLVASTQSNDTIAPVAVITNPPVGGQAPAGQPLIISGTASDGGGGLVAAVDVSVDGGATWRQATGTTSWTYSWTPSTQGPATIMARAIDDSMNVQTPAASLATTITPRVCPCSLFSATDVPNNPNDPDASEVELGVKFSTDVNGFITAIRFYKGIQNTGAHTVSLWDSTGALLSTAVSSGETASGWQQVTLPGPVAVTAGTTYVASYHTTSGHYSGDGNYFTNGYDNPPLHALPSSLGGNGVYRYGPSGFPTDSFNAGNYWVDVALSASGSAPPDNVPPTVVSSGPTGTLIPTTANATATFSEAVQATTISASSVELRDPANVVVPTSLSYNGSTRTLTIDPTPVLAFATTYTARIKGGPAGVKDLAGNPMVSDYTWSFTTKGPGSSLWSDTATPINKNDDDASAVELGVKFSSDVDGYVSAVRFYKGNLNVGPHIVNLWTTDGQLLATRTSVNETASGWQEVALSAPVAITAGTTYVASYHTDSGHYSGDADYFTNEFANVPLRAPASAAAGGNGVYRYGPSAFPNSSSRAPNYWVDIVFASVAPPDTTGPQVVAKSPTGSLVSVDTNVTAVFNENVAASSLTATTFDLVDNLNVTVPATVTYDAASRTATLHPTSPLAFSTTYTARVHGNAGGVTDQVGNPMTGDTIWTFTTKESGVSLWDDSVVPVNPNDADESSIELGVKFTTSVPGTVKAIRFYKSAQNVGPHSVHLWTADGTLLASAVATGETASGWQRIALPSPVPVNANTIYVASYHTDSGHYAGDGGYFNGGDYTNGPLTAPSTVTSGGNGLYQYGASAFPTGSYNGANYWVDLVFDEQLPTLSIAGTSVVEGNSGTTNAQFQVTLSAASNKTVSVHYATADGTATAGSDYTAASGTVTFAPGVTSMPIVVSVLGDTTFEPNETFTVTLSAPINATLATAQATGTILNDDSQPTISIANASVVEGNSGSTPKIFTVTLSAASTQTVSVKYATANGTAVAPADYTATSGTLTFAPGTTSKQFSVAVIGDTLGEGNETFTVNLSAPVNATIASGQAIGTIIDDDPILTLSINNASVTEGNSSSTTMVFTVTLSAASPNTVTVNYQTANGTAIAGADYTATSGTLTFSPGVVSRNVSVTILPDLLNEADETFTVNLSNAVNAVIATATGTGTIIDNDPMPSLSINNVTVTEGDSGTVNAVFTVTLSAASGRVVTVNYLTANGTATAPADYITTGGTLTFNPGTTSQSIAVPVVGDLLDEPNETFVVNLSGATNATISNSQGTGTILDNDPTPTLSINNASVTEGNTGTVNAVFTVTLSAASGRTVTVNYATAAVTATSNVDYTATSGTLTFAAGTTAQTIAVAVRGDTLNEPNETFNVNLSGATNATIAVSRGVGTIIDDDPLPTISINDVSMLEGNSGTKTMTFTVTLSAASGQTVSANYATANNTAVAGSSSGDYVSASGSISFAPGTTTQTIAITIRGDTTREPDETFFVNLSAASNATFLKSQGVGTILNDD